MPRSTGITTPSISRLTAAAHIHHDPISAKQPITLTPIASAN
jgi:hypothetical protein